MQGVTEVFIYDNEVTKVYDLSKPDGLNICDMELTAYLVLEDKGITPDLIRFTKGSITMKNAGITLREWIKRNREYSSDIAIDIYNQIIKMNECGVQHRDLHADNILVKDGAVKFIDFELARFSGPMKNPYDLFGPGEGVDRSPHQAKHNVYFFWDSREKSFPTLIDTLGVSASEVAGWLK